MEVSSIVNHEELTRTRERLYEEIRSLSKGELNRKPAEREAWSIGQICHHLILSEGSFADAIDYGLERGKKIPAEAKPIERALDRSIKTEAPSTSIPDPGPFQVTQLMEGLETSRVYFNNVVNKVDDEQQLTDISVKHPKFGRLSLKQWIELLPMHETRHIEQIQELKTNRS
ncbi:hypothetical protein JCM19037_2308 [Geomicrobium sp. JCM 19037]|nr:hypothetical protein JCM19037_2308 [Geomicrobium sp. JCM 19037]